MKLLRGSTRHRGNAFFQSPLITGSGPSVPPLRIPRTRPRENQFNNEVGTNPNAALRDHAGANLHRQTTTTPKKSVIVRLLWVFIVIISFTTVCLITAFAIQNSQYEELVSVGMKSSSHFNASVSVGFDPMMKTPSSEPFRLPGGHYIYSKQDLGAIKELCSEQLVHPTPVVVISHTTTRQCTSFDTCSEAARLIQLNIIGKRGSQNSANAADIGYNFLIGGDGNVYEGKGWDEMSSHRTPEGILGISFIGNYHKDRLTYGQIEAAQELLALGVKLEKLSPSYILVAHYQTASTDSPGKNIVKVIEKWPHWSPSYRIT
ncbi:peptidoglycan-recognition protein SC2-like isoform X2 [Zootermopsis nevadensis]|uniref:peptidoglycan-recognition protein SC2-like isoform X2 n=1 Tax=Zootermopsis nevadensis TaxID=136037 RepID=UPI000B8E8335|nr:peptidoglycan-recognition protein SC2-like isoform X2 [Zootermopsis nevadensis]XP_021921584.1 peptidoglycan-recognition protein SC2-like isoform X2 [Zootermopsis nevadensis]XP_021921585.1 peptidoglycan-recognition protein SC2-like isoform X2 [Zootermopsis nevadensis]XP_021921586.1 peptidoglycan-recognition protein SC2-like isoform X2 [Zootermopsis nevadensis]